MTVRTFYRDARARISIPAEGPNAGKKVEANWWVEGDLYCVEDRLTTNFSHSCTSLLEVNSAIYA